MLRMLIESLYSNFYILNILLFISRCSLFAGLYLLDKHTNTKEPIAQELHLLYCLELIHHGDRQKAKVSLDAYKKCVTKVGLLQKKL